jgi:hypothetical protein
MSLILILFVAYAFIKFFIIDKDKMHGRPPGCYWSWYYQAFLRYKKLPPKVKSEMSKLREDILKKHGYAPKPKKKKRRW